VQTVGIAASGKAAGGTCGRYIATEKERGRIMGISENIVTPEFICDQLAERFDEPCNMSPFEEELHDTEEKCEWCKKYCGKSTAADCWMRYFYLKYNEKRGGR
jgi:hypothetical protein